jgi:deazaflavin-dependent oxidoreductase (nitroreductase family)
MVRVAVRFYAELGEFLPPARRQVTFRYELKESASVKHVIESLGVPHTEVDLILVNGESVDFTYLVRDGDRISVYPVFESIDISPLVRVRPGPLREPRFVLDTHLGKLAAYLRMLGLDTLYRNDYDDDVLARLSGRERRILLTRDRGLLKRSIVTHGYHVRESDPEQQAAEVLRRFDLSKAVVPFRRCMRCNGVLEPVAKEAILDRLAPKTRCYYDEFAICQGCGRIYWKGSHYADMRRRMERLLGGGTGADQRPTTEGAMAATYRLGLGRRLLNLVVRGALRAGIAPPRYALLTVPGRRSGIPHSTPVIVLRRGADRWLVAPYGERQWVRNARAAGRVTLSRGRRRVTVPVEEVGAEEAGPVLREYVAQTPITRPFFAAPPDTPLADFVREAPRHPVFRLGRPTRAAAR